MGREWNVDVGEHVTTAAITPGEVADTIVVLAHGAGSHREHAITHMLADALAAVGPPVVRFDFLYRARGGGPPDRMPKLRACYEAVIGSVRERLEPGRLVLAGHSMGGRVASHLAATDPSIADGLLMLAYPLHPPRKPERLRDAHLPDISLPSLCLNGTRDPLCTRSLMDEVLGRVGPCFTMHWLEGADHGYQVLKRSGRTQGDVIAEVTAVGGRWMADVGLIPG